MDVTRSLTPMDLFCFPLFFVILFSSLLVHLEVSLITFHFNSQTIVSFNLLNFLISCFS